MWSSPFPCHLVPLRPKYFPQHPILENPQAMFLPQIDGPSFTRINTTGKIMFLYNSIFIPLDTQKEDKIKSP